MSIELKIKSKHLSLEAKVIRFEEQKLKKRIKHNREGNALELVRQLNSIAEHRRYVVGKENRATFLARAFIAGTPYKKVEVSRKQEREHEFVVYVLPRVLEMVKKYAPREMRKNLTEHSVKDWCFS